ncbi:hypothetical protein ECEC1864_2879, partial [Escherichia coli EC1864]
MIIRFCRVFNRT